MDHHTTPSVSSDPSSHPSVSAEHAKPKPLPKGDACLECKARKVRCPAQKPACMKCVKRNRTCTYSDVRRRQGSILPTTSGSSEQTLFNLPLSYTSPSLGWPTTSPEHTSGHGFLPSFKQHGEDQTPPNQWDDLDLTWLTNDLEEVSLSQDLMVFLYFTHQRVYGLEMHIATFYRRLEDPSDLPHPALIAAMYTVVSHASKSPAQRDRAPGYFKEAHDLVDEAIRAMAQGEGRLLDIMRAATLLAAFLWARGRDPEAIIMSIKAVAFARALGLDCFPTHQPTAAHFRQPRVRLNRHTFARPPADQIELADHLYAFWAVYLLDLSAAISTRMPPNLDPTRVTTPLPRPWHEYIHGTSLIDVRLSDLFIPAADHGVEPDIAYIARAITLVYYASFRHVQRPTTAFFVTPRVPPESDAQVLLAAIARFQASLPAQWTDVALVDGHRRVTSRTGVLQSVLGVAELLVHEVNNYSEPNEAAVGIARRLAGVVRLLGEDEVGDQSLFVYMMWVTTCRTLVKEAKRLVRAGDLLGAALIDADIDAIVRALRADRSESEFSKTEADVIMEWREGPPSEDEI